MTAVAERTGLIFLVLWLLACTAGCGNKGPLYLPDAEPVMEKPADTGSGPVESEPDQPAADAATM